MSKKTSHYEFTRNTTIKDWKWRKEEIMAYDQLTYKLSKKGDKKKPFPRPQDVNLTKDVTK